MTDIKPEEMEAAARKQGWKPESEWKGDPPSRGFVSAEEFLDAGSKSLPLATKQLGELEAELAETKADLGKIKQQTARYVDMTNKKMAKDREHIDSLIGEQQRVRADAISAADGDAVLASEAKIAELQQEKAQTAAPDVGIQEWIDENEWYESDNTLRDLADGMSNRLKQERPDLDGRAHLDELSTRVKKAMPDKFSNPNRKNAPPVEQPTRTATTNGKTFDDLPPAHKQDYENFKEMMAGMDKEYTKDQYMANYEWETE